MASIEEIYANSMRHLMPPPRLNLADWIEANVKLPDTAAQPGPVRLWPPQRGIADAISDPLYERVTVQKGTRVGYTILLSSAVASYVVNEPSAMILLEPTESDCRDAVVSDLEPLFAASGLAHLFAVDADDETGRNTLLHRIFGGGYLKVIAARSPRNLRRHSAKICSPTKLTPWK